MPEEPDVSPEELEVLDRVLRKDIMEALVEKNRLGKISDDHLVLECLHMVDPEEPALVLNSIPENILDRMLGFANEYLQGRMPTSPGLLPTQDQVLAAKDWIERSLQESSEER